MTTVFEPNGSITIKGNDRIIMTGKSIKSLPNLKLNMHSNTAKTFAYICNVKKDYNLSHKILGHISTSKFIELKNKDMFFDTKLINSIEIENKIVNHAYLANKQDCLLIE